METILVTGASGKLGKAVVEALLEKDFNVRAASRKTSRIKWTDRVRPVLFDYEDPGLHRAALDNIHAVFLIAPPLDSKAPEKLMPFIDKAVKTGVRHVVFNSVMTADSDEKNPLRIIERHLIHSGLDYTILRPNFFMENFLSGWIAPMIEAGSIRVPAGGAATSFISVEDIARVAAACFQERRYGEECDLTGSRALTYGDAARMISDACGRPIDYVPITEEEMAQLDRQKGMAESSIGYRARLFEAVRRGHMADTTSVVRDVTGKPPVLFEEFTRKNCYAWKIHKAA
ncbi:MAG: NAD(P)H-binding protein [Syntrophobacteraceae bacterium]|nr:NAD(P)H-binding protein [Syntrophobacteraceae bacterium]